MKSAPAISAHLQKLVLENVSDIIITTDLAFMVASWNHIAEQFYGIPAAEAIGKSIGELVSFTYHDSSIEEAYRALQQEKIWKGEVSYTNAKGERLYFLQTVKYFLDEEGKEVGILAVGRDITERKRAEEKLQESEKFYRTLIADSLDVTLLLTAEGKISFATQSVERLLGYTANEILLTNAFQYIHPEDQVWAMDSFNREIEENPDIKFILVRIRKKDGDWLWCMVRGHNLLNNPYINAIAVYMHDDTPRQTAMAALQESEKRFRSLIRDLHIGVLVQDEKGKILMTNQATYRMFNVSEANILGGKIWEIYTNVIHEDGRPFLRSERPSYIAIQTRQLVKDVVMGVWDEKKKDHVWIMISADPILDENGKLLQVVCTFADITERKKAEKKSLAAKVAHQRQLAQATLDGQEQERLEIGKELHDNIGQQLTTVKLLLDFAKTNTDGQTQHMIDLAVKGVSDIINEIRAISRSLVPSTLKDLGFIDSVNDLIDSLRYAQAMQIELDYFGFDEDYLPHNKKLALFRIIQEQLNNVIKHANASKVSIKISCDGKEVILQISDNGSGFDLEKSRKGMGLSNIANRAELFGGSVEILTYPGKGCEVKVWLPHTVTSNV